MSKNQIYLLIGAGCLIALCTVSAFAIGAFYLINIVDSRSIPEVVTIPPNPRPDANGNSMGDPNAPIHMEEFGDFQCPFCQRFHDETEPLLIEEYIKTGKVYFTYHSMGNWVSQNIGNGNTESQDAALAAYCAMDQNKFWEYHDVLFANVQGENMGSFTSRRLSALAEQINLNVTEFNSCFESRKYGELVQQDYDNGLSANVQGTPSFLVTYVVNNETRTKLIAGAEPFEVFQQELDAILKEIGN